MFERRARHTLPAANDQSLPGTSIRAFRGSELLLRVFSEDILACPCGGGGKVPSGPRSTLPGYGRCEPGGERTERFLSDFTTPGVCTSTVYKL